MSEKFPQEGYPQIEQATHADGSHHLYGVTQDGKKEHISYVEVMQAYGHDPKETAKQWAEHKSSPESNAAWLDPTFIMYIKDKYREKLEKQELIAERLGDEVTEHYKNILKTHVIESAIRDRIDTSQWLAGKGRLGDDRERGFEASKNEIFNRPDEEIKQQMAAMMDDENLEEKAEQAGHFKFRVGQPVQYAKFGKPIEKGWVVEEVQDTPSGDIKVIISKNGEKRYQLQDELLRMQGLKEGESAVNPKELVKDYINKQVKVRLDSGEVIEGSFGGISLNGGVYVDIDTGENLTRENGSEIKSNGKSYPKYNRIYVNSVEEFLETQKEIIDNKKLFQKDQEVVRLKNGELQEGWKVEDFEQFKDKIKVKIAKEGESPITIDQELLDEWQVKKDALNYEGKTVFMPFQGGVWAQANCWKIDIENNKAYLEFGGNPSVIDIPNLVKFQHQALAEGDERTMHSFGEIEVPFDQRKFKLGQEVKSLSRDRKIEDGWVVASYYNDKKENKKFVYVIKNEKGESVAEDILIEWQQEPTDKKDDSVDKVETTDKDRPQVDHNAKKEFKETPSIWDASGGRLKNWFNKLDEANTPEEQKRNKRKKRAAVAAGTLIGITLGWNVGLWATVISGPPLYAQHKFHNRRLKRKRAKFEKANQPSNKD